MPAHTSEHILSVPRIDGRPGLEDVTVSVQYGEKEWTSSFGAGRHWYQHDKVFLNGTLIGRVQTTNRKTRGGNLTSAEGSSYCVVGSDIRWLVRDWRENNGGIQGRLERITAGAEYRVSQTFGLLRTATQLGLALFTQGLHFRVTKITANMVEFKWGQVFPQGPNKHTVAGQIDRLDRSMFESLVESRSFAENR